MVLLGAQAPRRPGGQTTRIKVLNGAGKTEFRTIGNSRVDCILALMELRSAQVFESTR